MISSFVAEDGREQREDDKAIFLIQRLLMRNTRDGKGKAAQDRQTQDKEQRLLFCF